ncbi:MULTISPECIES: hypothetical protein [Jonquetella]|uniref:Uncharacterized protein n=1 Tax=Jonquetella anthropi DSM 22815 TaxID=885272 RepID=H0UJU1_9BACT|nr:MULTISPECIES: hypothetical protein [Jonquetella]EEX48700.1 hypothetical protein GCWU000246_00726 [Jonquetella anthropi E3_33 E1]EHM12950.1 hypothetical protein JonanDRAFT_0547 [Jonquetella anthropi DSM 22815]ERL23517.1 hypothetical protein HMPREF1249_0512 [Jonquetella sp. BV3C21]
MLNRRTIEDMCKAAEAGSSAESAWAAQICRQLLDLQVGETVKVSFEPGEEFLITCCQEGYELE